MLGYAKLDPQAGNLDDAENGRDDGADRKKPYPEQVPGLRILFLMIRPEGRLHLGGKLRRKTGFLSVLPLHPAPLWRLLFHQEQMLDDHQSRQDDDTRKNRKQDVAPDNPGIRPVQRLGHGKNHFIQRQIAPFRQNPLRASPCDDKKGNRKIKKKANHLCTGLFS